MTQQPDPAARLEEIGRLAQEVHEKQARLSELLRSGPPEPVDDVVFAGADGDVRLSELFGDKDDLILVHNMGKSCPYCTLWADGFNGVWPHLQDRAAFVIVSPDDPETQAEFALSRGWAFPMVSDAPGAFTEAMGYLGEHEGRRMRLPGFSTFRRRPDGSIVRIANAPFGPGDPYAGIWHLFALLDGGAGAWGPRFTYGEGADTR